MYPYDFKPKQNGINFREIFVVMPFDKELDDIFNLLIKSATDQASKILGLTGHQALCPYRTKEDIRTTSGWINVLEHLVGAQIVIGVLTKNNPNVFYELGIAHATQPITRQILLAEEEYEPTFDTKDLIFYKYKKNLLASVDPLASRIADAIKIYGIDEEKRLIQARMLIGPYEFEVIMTQCIKRNFVLHTSTKGRVDYEQELLARLKEEHLIGAFERHVPAITNLCRYGILGLNTSSRIEANKVVVEFSYHWTDFGNCLLYSMKLITIEELKLRREGLPAYFQ